MLDDIVNKFNNAYHRTVKVKPVDIEGNAYINFDKAVHDKDPKFKIGNHVRIIKTQKHFC